MNPPDYPAFFHQATGEEPFPYQRHLAEAPELPEVLHVPTGAGKTAASVLAWLWRRRHHPDLRVRDACPRRLIYCLPTRVLVEQTYESIRGWLRQLGLTETVGLYLLMGGAREDEWLHCPERDAILVGTQDMLLSRALNRGYGLSRFRWPAAFGLLNGDTLWVVDEVQLMGPGLTTTVQLDAFRRRFGAVGPCSTLWMSATLAPGWLESVDRPAPPAGAMMQLGAADLRHPVLAHRLRADKRLFQAGVGSPRSRGYARRLAELLLAEHQPLTLSLAVLNTVERAQAVFAELVRQSKGPNPELLLLHSRFRGCERQVLEQRLHRALPPGGRIVVATQVVEAGVDLSAHTLVTELAPWPSVVQRLGRCNRRGEAAGARAFWVDLDGHAAAPYPPDDLDQTRRVLRDLEGYLVNPAALPELALAPPEAETLRARDLADLFDTTPDLSGSDVDVARFIRTARDLDMQVFWRRWEGAQVLPEPEPDPAELCPVPVYGMREFLRRPGRRAWSWDHLSEAWRPVQPDELRPGMVLLLHSAAGGYHPQMGWSPEAGAPVPPLPPPSQLPPESVRDDRRSFGVWEPLERHTEAVLAEMEKLLRSLPFLEPWQGALRVAARWHDAGKAHPVFQATLNHGAPPGPEPAIWAKSGGPPRRHGRPHFRHELASALALLICPPQLPEPELSLAAYLVASHHGRVRLAIRSLPGEQRPPEPERRFALGIWEGDELLPADLGGGVRLPAIRLSNLDCMDLGRPPGAAPRWLDRTLCLRDSPQGGPFRLAFLEACLRAADVRASAAAPLQPDREVRTHG